MMLADEEHINNMRRWRGDFAWWRRLRRRLHTVMATSQSTSQATSQATS